MLQSMRDGISSPWIKGLLFIIAASMVSFYGFFGSSGLSQNVSASVNGEDISSVELSRAFQNAMAYQQSLGLDVSKMPPFIMERMQQQVLNGLIQQKLLKTQAQKSGFVTPKKAVKVSIQKQFTQGGQAFNFEEYKKFLEYRLGKSPAQFEEEEGQRIMVSSLNQAFTDTSLTPIHLLKAGYALEHSQAKVSYIKVNADNIKKSLAVIQPSNEALKSYFQDNQDSYRHPEQRSFTLSWLDLKPYLPEPKESDLKQTLNTAYTAEQKTKLKDARYRARHILIKGEKKQKADTLYQKLKAGASFEKTARNESEDPGSKLNGGDLGYFNADTMVPEFAKALDTLAVGEISKPVKSSFGYHIIIVLDKIESGAITSERLQKELTYTWKLRALEQEAYKNQAVATAKDKFAKTSNHKDFNNVSMDDPLPGIPDNGDTSIVLGKAMKTLEAKSSDYFTASSPNYLYQVRVNKLIPSMVPSYQSLHAQVKQDYLDQQYKSAFATFIAQKNQALLKKEIPSLKPLASELGLTIQNTDWFSAKNDELNSSSLNIDPKDLKPALSMNAGELFIKTIVQGNDHYFVQVLDRKKPNWEQFNSTNIDEKQTQDLLNAKSNQWLMNIRNAADIKIAGENKNEAQKS